MVEAAGIVTGEIGAGFSIVGPEHGPKLLSQP